MEELAYTLSEKLASLVDEHIIKLTIATRLMPKMAKGEVTVAQSWKQATLEVYAARNGGFTVARLDSPSPEEALKTVSSIVEQLKPSKFYAPLPQPTGTTLSYVDPRIKETVEAGDPSPILDVIQPTTKGDLAGMADMAYVKTIIVGSNGLDASYEKTMFKGYLRVFKTKDASGQWSWTSTRLDTGLAVRALEKAEKLADLCNSLPRGNLEDGDYRVLLSPMIAANLLEGLVNAQNAWNIMTGMSFLTPDKTGEKLYSDKLTVHEKPRDTGLPAFTGLDDEGVATKDRPIIDKGKITGLFHNTKTARILGTETTGNAGWVMPVYRNLHVEPGDYREEELLETLGDGVYLTNNWYTRYQSYVKGIFSTVARDAVIQVRNGKPATCLARIRIADTLPELFARIEAISRETWPIQWWEVRHPVIMPYLLVSKAHLTIAK